MAIKTIKFERCTYEGEVDSHNHPKGKGRLVYTSGTIHEGIFDGPRLNGTGKITYPSGEIWEGEFKNGNLYGHGKKTYASGAIWEGEFVYNLLNGRGKVTYTNGTTQEGEFRNGVLVEEYPVPDFPTPSLKVELPSRPKVDTYTGEKNSRGQPHGTGIMKYADGTVYDGRWKYGSWYKNGTYTDGDKVYEGVWTGTKSSLSVTLTENGVVRHGIMDEGEFIEIK